jgi:hypothetical protein
MATENGLVKEVGDLCTLYGLSNGFIDVDFQAVAVDSLNYVWVGSAKSGLWKSEDGNTWKDVTLPSDILPYDRYKNTRIIVTNRPRAGYSNRYVNQILGLIKT